MVTTSNLHAWYDMNETSGTVMTDAHNSNDGTISGATVNATGKIGAAYDFDGSNDYVDLTAVSPNWSSVGDFSVSLWVNHDTIPNPVDTWDNRDTYMDNSSGGKVYITLDPATGQYKAIIGSNSITVFNSQSISASTWYHVVLTYESSTTTTKLYVNANTPASSTSSPGTMATGTNTYLACWNGTNSFVNGRIDLLSVWTRTLSSTDVSDLYNSGSGFQYSDFGSDITTTPSAVTLSTSTQSPSYTFGVKDITIDSSLIPWRPTIIADWGIANGTLFLKGQGTKATKMISKKYPAVKGLNAAVESQLGNISNLVPTYTHVPQSKKKGL